MPIGGDNPNNGPDYVPDNITVVIGVNNTVMWLNNDSESPHTVTSYSIPKGAASFDSGQMLWLARFTYTFTVPGTYKYGCVYHPWMVGYVTVLPGSPSMTSHPGGHPAKSPAEIGYSPILIRTTVN